MQITVSKATEEEKETIVNLMQLYMHDFTEFTDIAIHSNGLFNILPDVNDYWTEKESHYPIILRYNLEIAGFALVKSTIAEERIINRLAHFFVLRKFRRRGLGQQAAQHILDLFTGEWEINQLVQNIPAYRFWTKTITTYTSGAYLERQEKGRTYQTFISKREEKCCAQGES